MANKPVTPSNESVSEDQITKFNQNVTARLIKNKAEIPKNIFQLILGDSTLIDEVFTSIRKRVDAIADMIIRTVKVNRNRSAKEALNATGRAQYVNDDVVATMPMGAGEEVDMCFFKVSRTISCNNLQKEYDLRGIESDPIAQMAYNEANPEFADSQPNATQWKDANGKWCYAAFFRWGGDERGVGVDRFDRGFDDGWWFGGVRKSTSNSEPKVS
ncbi:MAG: hypothetical protein ACR2IQ_01050 [Minisyncoccia bacterium]